MKKFLFLIAFLFFSTSLANNKIPVTIIKVIDGDTVEVEMRSGNKFAIRLIGIDCYEAYKNHRADFQAKENKLTLQEVLSKGKESKNYLNKLKNRAKNVSFEFKGLDKYSRVLGVLYFDGININQKLIDEKCCSVLNYKENGL